MNDLLSLFDVDKYSAVVERTDPIKYDGRIVKVTDQFIESSGPSAVLGEVCKILLSDGKIIKGEVIGLDKERVRIACYDEMEGIEIGNKVIATGEQLSVYVGDHLLGRVVDGIGKAYDGLGAIGSRIIYPAFRQPADAMKRMQIFDPVTTGVKAIDGMLTVGKGQRIGIFAGSGVGKSTLLGMIARSSTADVNVIAMIGERARELKEFMEYDLGEEGMKRSVIVFASSNKNALCRIRGAYIATAIAEYFRDQGKHVNLMMDSLTRFAWAQREVGLAAGEPPTTRGFTPSVFTLLPKLLERAGTGEKGSITGFYTVLVEGDDMDEPISDAVRGILDGHIVLSRALAHRNHYPAIDVLASISRLMIKITTKDQQEKAGLIRELIAEFRNNEEIINMGGYEKGANPKLDVAVALKEQIDQFLKQQIEDKYSFDETVFEMNKLLSVLSGENEGDENRSLLEDSYY